VNKNELIEAVSSRTDLGKSEAGKAVDAVFASVAELLESADGAQLLSFGVNPGTGKRVRITLSSGRSGTAPGGPG
jgi:Bacterial DNA-binding protein